MLNAGAELQIAGPVILTLANGIVIDGTAGNTLRPDWFILRVSSGGVTLNGNVVFSGNIIAPAGTITLCGTSQLVGTVACDRLAINGGQLRQPTP